MDLGGVLASASRARVKRASPRRECLHELYFGLRGESLFPEDLVALRVGRWKLIAYKGGLRDDHWYSEPRGWLNSSDVTAATSTTELVLRWLEGLTTAAKFDTCRDLAVHLGLMAWFRGRTAADGSQTLLFDVVSDPEERS